MQPFESMNHHIPCPGELRSIQYVRPADGLVGSDVFELLSRGSDEGSRKLVVGCFLSTWLCPSSNKPDSTPCCLLCLLLSSRSFPKNASWTWQHRASGQFSVFTLSFKKCQHTFLDIILGKHITMSHRNYCTHMDSPWELTKVKQRGSNKQSCGCWPHFCRHLPPPTT